MSIIRVSATKARNNFFELLNQVAMGQEVLIEKDSQEVALLSPAKRRTDWQALLKASRAARGILKDYDIERDSPLRKKGAKKFLGRIDRILTKSKKS